MKKFVLAVVALSMFGSVVSSSVLAASPPATTSVYKNGDSVVQNNQVSNELIQKASPFVVLDENSKRYYLKDEAKKQLTEGEFSKAQDLIALSNKRISETLKEGYQLQVTSQKTLKPLANESKGIVMSVDTNKYFDWELLWWGYRLYFSHQFLDDIKNHPLYIAGSAGIFNGFILQKLLNLPGWAANIVVGIGLVKLGQIIYADNGRGTYVDISYWNPNMPNIYGA
ncbi:hypothetical protein C8Z91_18190 [Paenibacillus elgii]|uniref:TM2 domain-containing protein n=1 Tax=Paenibacillus elgii TaxID=189691 RepID=A0A2T6G183_9BACL|nr:hypothetical protein [Paenibacillus elgii]PUA37888.1 hypothetical protein C8Z91_18190 [Paenibacillus elgii]